MSFVYMCMMAVLHVSLFAELIMAVGLVVDYMVHIVHYFLHQASEPWTYNRNVDNEIK